MKTLLCSIFLIVVVQIAHIKCTLPIEKSCGELKCPDHTFCSPIDHSCRSCIQICDTKSSNYDHARCESGCQDFIHDSIYLRRNESSTNGDYATKQDLESVKHILYCLIVITTLTLLLLVTYWSSRHLNCCLMYKQKKKKQKIILPIIYDNKYGEYKEKESMENKDNNNKRRSIRLEREPSESTLPEYAYDNPSLSHSPVHHV